MRAVIVLLALVAAPICASVSQNRTGPTRPAPTDRDALRNSNGRNGNWNDRDDGDQNDNDEKCDNDASRAARHGSPRSFEVRQDGRHEQRARHRHAGAKHDQDGDDCVGDPLPPPPPPPLPPTGGEISGAVYNDANGDGLRDPTEVGLGSWFVMLAGTTVPPVQTDANGNYAFTGLSAGSYTVCAQQRNFNIQTTPLGTACGSPGGFTIVLSAGQVVPGQDFGFFF